MMNEIIPEATDAWHELEACMEADDLVEVTRILENLPTGEVARVVDRLDEDDQHRLLTLLGPEAASSLICDLSHAQALDVLENLPAEQVADIVEEMMSDTQADVLGDFDIEHAEAILNAMEPEDAEHARSLLVYDEDTAGGLMQIELLRFKYNITVQEVIENLRTHAEDYSDFDVQYAYVVNEADILVGVLRMRDLLLAPGTQLISELMIHEPVTVDHHYTLQELQAIFDEKAYIGLPVVDEERRLLGVVLRRAVYEATSEIAAEDFLKVSGLSGREELRSMPLRTRSGRRLSWLSINILLNVLAASVIAFYQDTLAQVIALAVFLPIISDMSGCSGSQAVAVSIRELTLGLVRPAELLRVFRKELALGLVNGLALGVLIALVALLWKGNPWLGLVVGGALMVNTVVAVCLGGLIPLILKRFNFDPALASGPILTTVTDMCGFFLVLSLATGFLQHLI
ncbi:MAG: magnesium transporter [Kiritimatiellia bacterium]|jgi:magnesium transporter